MPKTTVKFVLDRETKGAVRYQEVDDNGTPVTDDAKGCVFRNLYVRKSALKGEVPKQVTVELNS